MSENQTHTLDEQSAHLIGQLAALKRELAEANDEIARLNQSLKSASTLYDAAKEQRDRLANACRSAKLCLNGEALPTRHRAIQIINAALDSIA